MLRPRASSADVGAEAIDLAAASEGITGGSRTGSQATCFALGRSHPRFFASFRTAVSDTPNFFANALIDRASEQYTSPIRTQSVEFPSLVLTGSHPFQIPTVEKNLSV